MKLYYHKTDGGAEYLTDKFIECANGHREGIFEGARYIVRIDGDIEKDAELQVNDDGVEAGLLHSLSEIAHHAKTYGAAPYSAKKMFDRAEAAINRAIASATGQEAGKK